MTQALYLFSLIAVGSPLLASIVTGLYGHRLGTTLSHRIAVSGVAIAFVCAVIIMKIIVDNNISMQEMPLYTWAVSSNIVFEVGFLMDPLTALMMIVVTFVSFMVHVYTIGYMHDDPGYARFFSYISLFTFSMLMLVMANNFLQLFFGWEAVGVVSYLLIGFWFKRDTAIFANMKAFLVNRVGDLGFLLGIAAIYMLFGSLNYLEVFAKIATFNLDLTITLWGDVKVNAITVACILLFIGAMGKSAQIPLHVWLPDSMEGPTPISALIHAATMVTAGVFMVARLSPLFELSEVARSFIVCIGALTALSMGLVGIVQNDIKRVIAYSTLSQLGYMIVAVGISAYAVGMFHLMTHAFFKALLFLAAGSIIMALHHQQDLRHMGGLRRYMPITYITALIGALALCGIPPFAGFYSKDILIEAVHFSALPGANLAYYALLAGVFVTALYTFRLIFLAFFGKERWHHDKDHPMHEPDWVVTLPLILLAIPSVIIGFATISPMLLEADGFFKQSITVLSAHDVMGKIAAHYPGTFWFTLHAVVTKPFWLAIAGIFTAYLCYVRYPQWPAKIAANLSGLQKVLIHKYGFDEFYQLVFMKGTQKLSLWCWQEVDVNVIDKGMVGGVAKSWEACARLLRHLQTGYLNQYAFAMILGLVGLISFWLWG
ncbi:MAG: NADH-quinone oxidoreductase subunit L [Legionellales bacterium]